MHWREGLARVPASPTISGKMADTKNGSHGFGGFLQMTSNLLLLTLLLFTDQEISPAAVFSSYVADQRFEFVVSRFALSASPRWSSAEPFPPLAPRAAVAAARRQLQALVTESEDWRLNEVSLVALGQEGEWVYLVKFEEPPPRADGGIHGGLDIAVLMDGNAVAPVVRPWP